MLPETVIQTIRKGLLLYVLGLAIGCNRGPEEQVVLRDFDRFLSTGMPTYIRYTIVSTGSGDGDSANVYKHIRLNIEATQDAIVRDGPLTSLSLKKGDTLSCGEALLLYQFRDKAGWVLSSQQLARQPQRGAPQQRC